MCSTQEELYGLEGRPLAGSSTSSGQWEGEGADLRHFGPQWAYIHFEQPVTAPKVGTGTPTRTMQ